MKYLPQFIKCLFDIEHKWYPFTEDATSGGYPGYNWTIMLCKCCNRGRSFTKEEREEYIKKRASKRERRFP